MNARQHLDPSTILAYSSGSLSTPFQVVARVHLEACGYCRQSLADAEAIGAHFIDQQRGEPMSAGARDSFFARLCEAKANKPKTVADHEPDIVHPPTVDRLPSALQPHFGSAFAALPWKSIAPGIAIVRAKQMHDGNLFVLKIAPGRSLPMHTHGANELTVVLQGAYEDHLGRFGPGDAADLDDTTTHAPVVTPGAPCICVAATDAPLRFSGWLARVLQPLVNL